jgi:hypothetical protein
MSDFLTNLAARNLDRATAVRPRAALPFEDAGRAFQSSQPPAPIAGWSPPLDSDFAPDQFAVEETLVEVPARRDVERKVPLAGERIERETGRRQEWESGRVGEGEKGGQGDLFSLSPTPSSALSKRLPPEQSKGEGSFTAAHRAVIDQSPRPNGSVNPSLRPQASISRHSDSPDDWLRRVFEKSTQNGFAIETVHQPGRPEDHSLPAEVDVVEKKQSPGQSRQIVASDSESANGFVLRPAWPVKPIITRRGIAQSDARAILSDSQAPGGAQPEPIIQVTIGRIEVRVTAPAPPAKNERRPAAPPMMSLDDYLQQRSRMGSTGGGR